MPSLPYVIKTVVSMLLAFFSFEKCNNIVTASFLQFRKHFERHIDQNKKTNVDRYIDFHFIDIQIGYPYIAISI